jgi:hypothetical protein
VVQMSACEYRRNAGSMSGRGRRRMSRGVMRATHAYFSAPVLNYMGGCGWNCGRALTGACNTCPASREGACHTSNALKAIANLADATSLQGARRSFSRSGGSGMLVASSAGRGRPGRFTQFCAGASTGDSAYRRPPVWRAVVRPARYFFMGPKTASPLRANASRARSARRQKAWFLPAKSGSVVS